MMKKMTALTAVLLLAATALSAHPHFSKSVETKIGEVEVKLQYFTAPANMEHLEDVQKGAFNPGFGRVEFSADLSVGDLTIPTGKYQIGAIKNGDKDWTLGLYPGGVPRGSEPDMSKVIKLHSAYSESGGNSGHVYFDILPGHGKMEGKAVLIWQFGPLHLEGALS